MPLELIKFFEICMDVTHPISNFGEVEPSKCVIGRSLQAALMILPASMKQLCSIDSDF